MANIVNLQEAWEGHSGAEVEAFIKAQFGTKFGDFRTTSPDTNNFIHILCFATKADANLYDTDPETYGPGGSSDKVVKNLTIPISTASVDSYIGTLSVNRSTSTQYLVKDGDSFVIPLRFNAKHVIAATSTQEAMSGSGTLIVERSPNGTTWTQVKTQMHRAMMFFFMFYGWFMICGNICQRQEDWTRESRALR